MWQLLFTTGLLMICVRWNSVAAADRGPVYVAVNGSAVLHPGSTVPESITTATWKYGENKAAELFEGEVTCYRQFKGRCELDAATGVLTISPLAPSDSGHYSAEVNLNRADTVQLQVLDPVPKPLVSLECDAANTHCRLTCEGTTADPGLLEYRWKEDNEWSVSSKELNVTKKNQEPEFSCEMKNPVSSSRSDRVQNPLRAGNSSAIIIGVVVCVLLLLIVAAVVLFLCHRRRDAVQQHLRNLQSRVRHLCPGSGGAGPQHEVVKLSANGSGRAGDEEEAGATEVPLLESGGVQQEPTDGLRPLLGAGDQQESGAGLPSPPGDVSPAAVASSSGEVSVPSPSAEDHRVPDEDPGASGTSASNSDPVAVDVDVEVAAEACEDPAESREDAETEGSGPGVPGVEPASRGPGLVTTADVHPEPPQDPSPSPEDHRGPDQDRSVTSEGTSSDHEGPDQDGQPRPEDQDGQLRPEDQDGQLRPEDQNKQPRPEDQNKQPRPEDQNKKLRPEDQDKKLRPEDQDGQPRPEDQDEQLRPEDQDEQLRPEDQDGQPRPETEETLRLQCSTPGSSSSPHGP